MFYISRLHSVLASKMGLCLAHTVLYCTEVALRCFGRPGQVQQVLCAGILPAVETELNL